LLTIHTSDASSTERVRINSSGDVIVGSGITVSPDGDIFATGVTTSTTFVGNLTGNVTGTASGNAALTGSTNNTVTTVTGANAIQGEANLTFDGDTLLLKSSTDGRRVSFAGDGTSHYMKYDNTLGGIILNGYGGITFETNGTNERARIDSSGRFLIGSTNGASYADSSIDDLIIGSTASGKNDGITILSGTGQNGTLAFADSGGSAQGLVGYVHNGDYLRLHAGNSLKVRIDTDGLKFNSDTAAANALDDYEEGSFTPILYYVSGTSGVGYAVQEGRYTKIGRLVSFQLRLALNGKGSGNNNVRIGGLPFTPSTSGVNYDMFLISVIVGCNLGSARTPFAQLEDYSVGRITLYSFDYGSASDYAEINSGHLDNDFTCSIQGNYITAS